MPHNLDALIESWIATIPESIRHHDIPGLAIGVCDAQGAVWSAGFGSTRRGGGVAVTPTTRFSVQSTSKFITATAVLAAVGAGLVDLDEPISTYLPEFSVHSTFDERPQDLITLRHLLSHTAGFTHEAPSGSNYDLGAGDFDTHCQSIMATWLRFPVGSHFEYSNLGIDLAGYLLQRVSGLPFSEYVHQALLAPLGMQRSTFDPAVVEADPKRAIGHWRPFDEAGQALPVAVPMVPAGGLYTTVEDCLKFVGLHLRNGTPLLTDALLREHYRVPFAPAEQRLGYALGVYIDEWPPGVRVQHHGGSGFGFQAQLCWLPDASLGVVVLTNSFDHDLQNTLARQFVDHVAREAQLPRAERREQAAAVDADVDALLGDYIGRLSALRIRHENDALWVERGGVPVPARVIGELTIELSDDNLTRLEGSTDQHEIAYLRDLRDGSVFYRNDAARVPASTIDAVRAGSYSVSAWGVPIGTYRIAQQGSSPTIQAGDEVPLRLAPVDADRYLSSTGEVLDLSGASPTYANIRLDRHSDDPTSH